MTVSKTPRKRIAGRDASTGKFERADDLTDPALLDFAVRTVKAIRDLEPLLAALAAAPHDPEDHDRARLMAVCGLALSVVKDSMLEVMAVDPESMAEVKKKRVEAARLGNVPLAEVQRVQAKAQAWMALPDVAVALLDAKPHTAIGGQP